MIDVLSRKVYAANAPRLLWRRSMEGRLILWDEVHCELAMTQLMCHTPLLYMFMARIRELEVRPPAAPPAAEAAPADGAAP